MEGGARSRADVCDGRGGGVAAPPGAGLGRRRTRPPAPQPTLALATARAATSRWCRPSARLGGVFYMPRALNSALSPASCLALMACGAFACFAPGSHGVAHTGERGRQRATCDRRAQPFWRKPLRHGGPTTVPLEGCPLGIAWDWRFDTSMLVKLDRYCMSNFVGLGSLLNYFVQLRPQRHMQ